MTMDGDTLQIGPATSELDIVNGVQPTEGFTATLVHKDGTSEDVTATTTFTIDSLGSFAGPTLTLTAPGKAHVFGNYSDTVGTAEVIGRMKTTRVDPSLPSNAGDLFGGPDDPTRAPTIVYPPIGTVMPRNVGDFEVHWTDTAGNDIFEVSLHSTYVDTYVYVPISSPADFTAFTPTEWSSTVSTDSVVTFQVRGVSSANPTTVGSSQVQQVALSNEDMLGGLYYWASTAASGVYGIFRHDMSKPGQPAEQYMTTAQSPSGRCVACHVLSRDGTKMAITLDGGGGQSTFIDVASSALQPIANNWNFGTFTADGNRFFSVEGGSMVLRNYADQSVVATVPAPGFVSHPDVSADGLQLVYVLEPSQQADWSFTSGQIVVQSFDPVSVTFGTPRVLVSDTNNNYYPSWSPDGQWVLFNKAVDGGSSYNDASTSLWVVKADGSSPPIELAAANTTTGLTNSWGRWAPFAQSFGANNEPMYWVTVSSKRAFGVRLAAGQPQIWMTPFFPQRAIAGKDPSVPMFRLPFQDIDSNNHIAQWTEKVVVTQ
jgi:hypothetical protein